MERIVILILGTLLLNNLHSSQIINGIVVNSENTQIIENANIYISGTSYGTQSNEDGYFSITIPDSIYFNSDYFFIINHVAFDPLKISLTEASSLKVFKLSPAILVGDNIVIKGRKETLAQQENPVAVKIIMAELIENKAYLDLGDLIRLDQSIQIEEQLSGKKSISLRAGNADDVLILYNGIKVNNNYSNTFDLSLINPEDIQRIEIIKGSNTSLYGGEAFSGIINIVPKLEQDHKVRFVQKIGSYNSGDWNLNINHGFNKNLFFSYSQRRYGSERQYDSGDGVLKNLATYHTANFVYKIPETNNENVINVIYMYSKTGYSNNQLSEAAHDFTDLTSVKYSGDIGTWEDFELISSYQRAENDLTFSAESFITGRNMKNNKISFTTRKKTNFNPFSFIFSYQFDKVDLNLYDNREFFSSMNSKMEIVIDRERQGIVGLIMYDSEKAEMSDILNISLSYRIDNIEDNIRIENSGNQNKSWGDNSLKVSVNSSKKIKNINWIISASSGTNIKYPSLFNQLSTPQIFENQSSNVIAQLLPEEIKSQEIGLKLEVDVPGEKKFKRIDLDFTYFQNYYKNKFRNYYTPYNSFSIFDNVKTAEVSGFEASLEMSTKDKLIAFNGGFSLYDISDKAAFPLKSESKLTAGVSFEKEDYNFQFNYFNQGERTVWIRDFANQLGELILPSSSNINIYAGKKWSFYDFSLVLNMSAMNILTDESKLNGLIINDRRIYLGVEVKY
jgi:outer membrane cobalamin receptor